MITRLMIRWYGNIFFSRSKIEMVEGWMEARSGDWEKSEGNSLCPSDCHELLQHLGLISRWNIDLCDGILNGTV